MARRIHLCSLGLESCRHPQAPLDSGPTPEVHDARVPGAVGGFPLQVNGCMRLPLSIGALLLCLCPAPGLAQSAWNSLYDHRSCAAADSVLGPQVPGVEDLGSLSGYYDPKRDSSHVHLDMRVNNDATIFTTLQLPGPGPFELRGIPLGLTISSNARKLKMTRDSLPVTLTVDDSLRMRPGFLRIGQLDMGGPYATVQVTALLTRATFRALLNADHAELSWPTMTVPLNNNDIGALRAMARVLLCAPASLGPQGLD